MDHCVVCATMLGNQCDQQNIYEPYRVPGRGSYEDCIQELGRLERATREIETGLDELAWVTD
jgi:hypothetical protein